MGTDSANQGRSAASECTIREETGTRLGAGLTSQREGTSVEVQLELLFVRMEARLTNTLYRYLWDLEEVREVVQESFLRLWRKRDEVDWTNPEPLVYRIAVNLASNRLRAKKLWRWVPLADRTRGWDRDNLQADALLATSREEAALKQAIGALPERYRGVLILCDISELSYEEVGKILDIPAGTVSSRRNVAIKKVKTYLERRERKR